MHQLGARFEQVIRDATGCRAMHVAEVIQELWSGYGKILRISLEGGHHPVVVAKHVRFPGVDNHPRGWNSTLSHERKVRSYQVETHWYRHWSSRCDGGCRVPEFLAYDRVGDEVLIVLEDLDQAGYPVRLGSVEWEDLERCLRWLACFHATFMNASPDGLWDIGTYWHLDTRPEELRALDDEGLREAAGAIDRRLNEARFRTLVHGDAKLANFCFPTHGEDVAAVDFQYVGGGCGMKDVAYFVGSCLDEFEGARLEPRLLDRYFTFLGEALGERQPQIDIDAVVAEWRELYPFAWTDFHRFLKGWSPGHWKINSYSERLAREVVASVQTVGERKDSGG